MAALAATGVSAAYGTAVRVAAGSDGGARPVPGDQVGEGGGTAGLTGESRKIHRLGKRELRPDRLAGRSGAGPHRSARAATISSPRPGAAGVFPCR